MVGNSKSASPFLNAVLGANNSATELTYELPPHLEALTEDRLWDHVIPLSKL